MTEAFLDSAFNVFDEGPVYKECQENLRICLKNVSAKLQRHAIRLMMEQFGTVVDFNIPTNQETYKNYKPGFVIVFVEFSKFA